MKIWKCGCVQISILDFRFYPPSLKSESEPLFCMYSSEQFFPIKMEKSGLIVEKYKRIKSLFRNQWSTDIRPTGVFIMIDEKSELICQARKIPIFSIGHIHFDIYPSKNTIENQWVFIHIWRLLRCIIVQIWKTYWKLTITERHYHFVNISVTKAQIFMKF